MHPPPLSSCKSLSSSQKKTSKTSLSSSGWDSETPLPGSWVWPLIRELSFHMAGAVGKNPKKQQQQPRHPAPHEAVHVPFHLPWVSGIYFLHLWIYLFWSSCKWNNTICGFMCLVSFFLFFFLAYYSVFEVHSHCSIYQNVSPCLGWLISVVHRDHVLFIHLSINGCLCYFPPLATVNNAATCSSPCFHLRNTPRSRTAGSDGKQRLNFVKDRPKPVFKGAASFYYVYCAYNSSQSLKLFQGKSYKKN